MSTDSALSRTFVALDNMTIQDVRTFLKNNPEVVNIKIGPELFSAYGQQLVHTLRNDFKTLQKIFLDLKLHDIPQTVKKTIMALETLPVDFLTIHLSGGREMLRAALEAQKLKLQNTQLLGVSFLTSLDENDFLELWGIEKGNMSSAFNRLFTLALNVEMHGLILSPLELKQVIALENSVKKKILKITPGIRFREDVTNNQVHDQKRMATFDQAFSGGADYIVIGRSLTNCQDIKSRLRALAAYQVSEI